MSFLTKKIPSWFAFGLWTDVIGIIIGLASFCFHSATMSQNALQIASNVWLPGIIIANFFTTYNSSHFPNINTLYVLISIVVNILFYFLIGAIIGWLKNRQRNEY